MDGQVSGRTNKQRRQAANRWVAVILALIALGFYVLAMIAGQG